MIIVSIHGLGRGEFSRLIAYLAKPLRRGTQVFLANVTCSRNSCHATEFPSTSLRVLGRPYLVVERVQACLQDGSELFDLGADRVPDVAENDEFLSNERNVGLQTIIARLELGQLALLSIDFIKLSLFVFEIDFSLCGRTSASVLVSKDNDLTDALIDVVRQGRASDDQGPQLKLFQLSTGEGKKSLDRTPAARPAPRANRVAIICANS